MACTCWINGGRWKGISYFSRVIKGRISDNGKSVHGKGKPYKSVWRGKEKRCWGIRVNDEGKGLIKGVWSE